MDRKRYRRIAIRATAGIGLLFTLVAVVFVSELWRTGAEMNAVLSDIFTARLNKTPDLVRSYRIIIMSKAQPPGRRWGEETIARWGLFYDEKLRFPQASLVTRGSFLLTNGIPTYIRPKLNLPRGAESVVLSNNELDKMTREELQEHFPENFFLERFSISQLGLNFSKTEAISYYDRSCRGCIDGGSGYVLVRKIDGVWRIVDEHNTHF